MIAADKNLLKATIQQGTLRIQNKLIQLYQLNLDSIAVNGALLAIYSFKGLSSQLLTDMNQWLILLTLGWTAL